MNKSLYCLVFVQFVSAFADNALLFAIVAMVLKSGIHPTWYVPALQSVFLLSYILLAPWVGMIADRYAKSFVLVFANFIKALGCMMILMGVDSLISYAVVGIGAAIYSPAKYGLLPELAHRDQLIKANGWVEGATIVAILLGTLLGAKVADISTSLALMLIVGFYVLSSGGTFFIPKFASKLSENSLMGGGLINRTTDTGNMRAKQMILNMKSLLVDPKVRLVLFGLSFFWAVAACLRVILVAWAPLVLKAQTASDVAELTFFLAIGIVIGSALASRIIPIEKLMRVCHAAFFMALFLIALAFSDTVWPARLALLLTGIAAGIFIVPMNATLQDIGHQTIGSGAIVAIQNFFQNAAMLLAVGAWTIAAGYGIDPASAILTLGLLVLSACIMLFGFVKVL